MVQPINSNINKPIYNAVKINISKPEVNKGENSVVDDNGIYNAVLSVRLAIGCRYPYRKPIAERIYTKPVCKLDMPSHCYSVLSDTWYFGGSMACEK